MRRRNAVGTCPSSWYKMVSKAFVHKPSAWGSSRTAQKKDCRPPLIERQTACVTQEIQKWNVPIDHETILLAERLQLTGQRNLPDEACLGRSPIRNPEVPVRSPMVTHSFLIQVAITSPLQGARTQAKPGPVLALAPTSCTLPKCRS